MSTPESRTKRNRSIRHAVWASLASKGCSLVLQFVSLPIAARLLGKEEFGIYATVFVSLYMVELLQIGVGPALAKGIAEAAADSDRDRERSLYLAGGALVFVLALFAALLGALVVGFVPLTVLFGEGYEAWQPVMLPALWTGIALCAAEIVSKHTDRVREGYMEASTAIAWVAAGNLIGALAVIVFIQFFPSPSTILLAVFLPTILVRMANAAFLLKKRPWLVSPIRLPEKTEMGEMLKDGVFFTAISTMAYLVEFSLAGLLVGRVLGPSGVAIHFVLMIFVTAFQGLLIMVGNPLWAAIVDARKKGDYAWMKATTGRYYQFLALITLATSIGLVGLGPWLIPLVFGPEFEVSRLLLTGHAFFLFALGWRRVNRYVAIGLGLLPKTVFPILIGLGVSLICGLIGLHQFGLGAFYFGLGLGAALVSGVILPYLVWQELNKLKNEGNRSFSEATAPSPGKS